MKTSKCCNSPIHEQNGLTYCSHCISIIGKHEIRRSSKLAFIIASLLFSLFIFVHAGAPNSNGTNIKYAMLYKIESEIIPDVALNDYDISEELHKDTCSQIPWVMLQIHVETRALDSSGMPVPYTSRVCLECKNLGGVRFRVKGSRAIGQTNDAYHYLIYASYRDCLYDMSITSAKYLHAIDGHYAEDKNYVKTLKNLNDKPKLSPQ